MQTPEQGSWDKKLQGHRAWKLPADRLDGLSVKVPFSGCLIWTGALNDSGYGRVKIGYKFRRAHIVAWEQQHGKVPTGQVIDHLCRVRCCINPDHMEVVTQSENCRRSNILRAGETRNTIKN